MANPVLPTSKSLLTSSEAATKHLNKMEETPSMSKLEQVSPILHHVDVLE